MTTWWLALVILLAFGLYLWRKLTAIEKNMGLFGNGYPPACHPYDSEEQAWAEYEKRGRSDRQEAR